MGPFQLQLSEKGEACAKALGASVVFIVVQQPRAHETQTRNPHIV